MNLTTEQWQQVTRSVHGKIMGLFKPKANLVILDFIQTAAQDIPGVVKDITEQEKK